MRHKLQKIDGQRMRFRGTFERFGKKRGWHGQEERTLLLKDVCNSKGKIVADHLWFSATKGFMKLEDSLVEGVVVAFDARVSTYTKLGEFREFGVREVDYRLSHPTKIEVIS